MTMTTHPPQHMSQKLVYRPLTFAGLNTLGPCVIELWVSDISTVLEPSPTASATAAFTGVLGSPALGTYGSNYV